MADDAYVFLVKMAREVSRVQGAHILHLRGELHRPVRAGARHHHHAPHHLQQQNHPKHVGNPCTSLKLWMNMVTSPLFVIHTLRFVGSTPFLLMMVILALTGGRSL